MRMAVLGGGSWGTALANLLAIKGYDVCMLMRDRALANNINITHINAKYLPGQSLSPSLRATVQADEAFAGAEIVLLAVPCQYMRGILRANAKYFFSSKAVVCTSKGLELHTLKTMSGVVREELPQVPYSILSGPSFAAEIVRGLPAAVVLGCADKVLGDELQTVFSTETFRVYFSSDVAGVEVGGAIKNVLAIAVGISDGLGFGYNARAALITRGLAEMRRLGVALGARPLTFMGLSGMGDLVLTCTGDLSRNRQVGLRLAQGKTLVEISSEMFMVAEGVKTTDAAVELGDRLKVDLPISVAVQAVLTGKISPGDAVRKLMRRDLKEE